MPSRFTPVTLWRARRSPSSRVCANSPAPTQATTWPAPPADFFNLVGMAEWHDLDEKFASRKAASWA